VSRTARWATTIVAVLGLILGTAVPATAAATPAAAAVNGPAKMSLAGFNPGNIISDAVFTDRSTMTEAQIQTFFNSKVKTCRAGYTCLKDYRTTSVTRPADNYCKGYAGAANESAARIIYRVAQACDINPQVLIVMLQKEQGLINHTWPSQWRYDAALGQACPDTAPCDPKFVGFFHQIYGAARQMQIYMEGRYFQWYKAGQTWQIQWHPDRALWHRTGLHREQGHGGPLLLHAVPAERRRDARRIRHGRLMLELRQPQLLQLLHRLVRLDSEAARSRCCASGHDPIRGCRRFDRCRLGVPVRGQHLGVEN